jgi:hypothetical protein
MSNILSHKGNANQNTPRFHLTPVRLAISRKQISSVGEDSGKREPSYIVGR